MKDTEVISEKRTIGEELYLIHLKRQREHEEDYNIVEIPRKRSRSIGEELYEIHLKRSQGSGERNQHNSLTLFQTHRKCNIPFFFSFCQIMISMAKRLIC